jgi:WD40 repeat protein
MTFYNLGDQQIEVWDMGKLSQGRRFRCSSEAIALSFTTDNRFLVSSHKNGKLNIWSIVDDELYKSYDLGGEEMIWHCFTPDNQFMVSIFRGKREANVWNNYLGRITSSR